MSANMIERIKSYLVKAGRPERTVFIGLGLSALALFVFVDLAGDMLEGESRRFDEWVLFVFRSASDKTISVGPSWLNEMMRDVTALGSTIVMLMVTLAVIAFLRLTEKRRAALWVFAAVMGGAVISTALKYAFNRPRPDIMLDTAIYSASFPSGHAMMSAVVYLTLGALIARTQQDRLLRVYIIVFSVFLALIIGISRIYLGVHWPTDVLAGWALGAGWAMVCWTAMIWLQRGGIVEPPIAAKVAV